MIKLYTFSAAFGQFSPSPFCTKAAYLLNLAGVSWEREDVTDPRKFPKGKLPAIEVEGRIIDDSEAIRVYLAETGHDVDAHLNPQEQADLIAYRRLSEHHLYFQLLNDRWGNEDVWPVIRDLYFSEIPGLLRGIITRQIRKPVVDGLKMMGLSRFSADERLAQVDTDLKAIAAKIGDGPFFFGETPCSLDASLGAMLDGFRGTPVATPLSKRVAEDAALCAYIDRVIAKMG